MSRLGFIPAPSTAGVTLPIAESDVTGLTTDLAAKQPLDSDLTTIAAVDSSQTGVLASDGSGWIRKSWSAAKTALGIGVADVSGAAPLASPTFTGTVTLPSGTVTSAMITDGTIVDADINASAAIAQSKVATLVSDLAAKAPLVPFIGPRVSLKSTYYSGRYLNQLTSTGTVTNNAVRAYPMYVQGSGTLDRIAAEVTTAGESGSKLRLGIYADDGTGYYPGTQLFDSGDIAADSTGFKEATCSVGVANQQIWLMVSVNNGPTTVPTFRTVSGMVGGLIVPSSGQSGSITTTTVGYSQSSVTGALPQPFVHSALTTTEVKIQVRAA